jgi:N6-adenosine-specific RNA methylase IME4
VTWEGLTPPYATIVADPPWPTTWNGAPGGRRARDTRLSYSLLPVEGIAGLPVSELAAKNAHLWLWVTPQLNRRGVGVQVAEAWGFRVHDEMVWRKPNFGAGAFPRHGHEILLVCRRYNALAPRRRDVHPVQDWRSPYTDNGGKAHSRKPDGAYDLIAEVSPAPRVELFARSPRLGWDHWGLGYEVAS